MSKIDIRILRKCLFFFFLSIVSLAGSACKSDSSLDQKKVIVKEESRDEQLIEKAKTTIQKYNLTSLSTDCLGFIVSNNQAEGKDVVDVHENHKAPCKGDPNTFPRLFTIKIEPKTGKVWTDAKSSDGQFDELK